MHRRVRERERDMRERERGRERERLERRNKKRTSTVFRKNAFEDVICLLKCVTSPMKSILPQVTCIF